MTAVEDPRAPHQGAIVYLGNPTEGVREDVPLHLRVDRPLRHGGGAERQKGEIRVGRDVGDHVEAERVVGQDVVGRNARVDDGPRKRELGLVQGGFVRVRATHDRRPVPVDLHVALHEQLAEVHSISIRRANVRVGNTEAGRQVPSVLVLSGASVPEQDRTVRRDGRPLLVRAGHQSGEEHDAAARVHGQKA
ncbi:MAG: hypothetical protein E6J64_21410 [Deltaproteobacteria bacterium]|nr:MAG: hypothetical protein E6J64_21410 [Deltaproteobacteria bacterium]